MVRTAASQFAGRAAQKRSHLPLLDVLSLGACAPAVSHASLYSSRLIHCGALEPHNRERNPITLCAVRFTPPCSGATVCSLSQLATIAPYTQLAVLVAAAAASATAAVCVDVAAAATLSHCLRCPAVDKAHRGVAPMAGRVGNKTWLRQQLQKALQWDAEAAEAVVEAVAASTSDEVGDP